MKLSFLDRRQELQRLRHAVSAKESALAVLYGRRRCGKSRLLLEGIGKRPCVYHVGDEREGSLQRRSLAKAIATLIPGFDRVEYPEWEALLDRWWREAPEGSILALDEFSYLVTASPELPSLLQKRIDAARHRPLHLILCGSSQRMMHGLVLDSSAPLYGRAREIMKVQPLAPGWIAKAFSSTDAFKWLESYALWGGIPRYWELANEFPSTEEAVLRLVLDPLGVLREEPSRLLLDDLKEIVQASSILSLIGEGCHKVSELAGRLGKPATSLSRPLSRLVDLGLVHRETPFGASERDSKRSCYKIADPFLGFWFRFVDPKRALVEARQESSLRRDFKRFLPSLMAETWEELARKSVPHLRIAGRRWRPASRWWGAGTDRESLEIDIVALSEDGSSLLVGEAKLRVKPNHWEGAMATLRTKIARFSEAQNRKVIPCIWCAQGPRPPRGLCAISAHEVFEALR